MNVTRLRDRAALPLVIIASAFIVGFTYAQFWPNVDHLFWDMTHDRNAHYYQGLSMALNLKAGDVAGLARDIDSCRVWGILHPALVAIVELSAGPNVKLGVLPSVLGWFGAAVFAFLLPRRACPEGGTWAGVVAAALVLASPAHRAYATDIMLESSGACLTLAILYAYLIWVQEPSRRSALGLAIALSLLFFEKYNYWLLAAAALAINEAIRRPRLPRAAFDWLRRSGIKWTIRRLRRPLTILALVLAAGGFVIAATGGTTLSWRSREISLRNPHNLVHIAYLCVFAQIVLWWIRGGKRSLAAWPDEFRLLAYGHLAPILIWFAFPKRLFNFLWYLSPANAEHPHLAVLPGLSAYWSALQDDYHADPVWLSLAVGLGAAALLGVRRLRPGSSAVFWLLAVAALLTAQHPMAKNRFLHSWIACLWVAAGIGLVQVLRLVLNRWPRAAGLTQGLTAATCAALLGVTCFQPGHSQEGGVRLDRPTTLALSRTYLPAIQNAREVAVLCNVQTAFELRWTFLESFRRTRGMSTDIKGYDPKAADADQFLANWLATTTTDSIIVIDVPKSSPMYTASPLEASVRPIVRALEQQSTFTRAQSWRLEHGETIELWSRAFVALTLRVR
jgi:hypothetical protein